MSPLTQLIPVIADRKAPGYRLRIALAYIGVFFVSAGDTVRYSIGWTAWGAACVALAGVCLVLFLRSKPSNTLRRMPFTLSALLGFMVLSTAWSFYPAFTLLGFLGTLVATIFGLFLVATFSWRDLLGVFSNVFKFIIGASILFELFAALVVHGPIAPIFKNYQGVVPPSGAYYWTQGTLLKGLRIQGIVGNANLLAYIAMLGFLIFAVQYAIKSPQRWISVASMGAAAFCLALTRSAGIGFAMVMVAVGALVALVAEGHDRETRHRYYRVAWTGFGIVAFFILVYREQLFTLIGKSPDMTGRTEIWKAVLGLISERWFQGWGWISYWIPGVKPYEGLIVRDNVTYYQAHNSYLDVWLQLGIIGFILFIALLTITFVKLWRLAVRHTSPLYLWPLLVFIAILVQNLTESRMIVELGWLLVVILSVKVNEPAEFLEPRGSSPKRLRMRLLGKAISAMEPTKEK
jgi:exopolysaccharide production protein ExoQ